MPLPPILLGLPVMWILGGGPNRLDLTIQLQHLLVPHLQGQLAHLRGGVSNAFWMGALAREPDLAMASGQSFNPSMAQLPHL